MQLPFFQNWLAQRATKYFSTEFGTPVTVRKVSFGILNKIEFDDLLIIDKQADTLLYAGNAKSSFTDFFFLKDKAALNALQLSNVVVNLLRKTDSVWNYQYLVNYFGSTGPPTGKKQKPEWTLYDIDAKNIKFLMLDKWLGKEIKGSLDVFKFDADSIDFGKQKIILNELLITKPFFSSNAFVGIKIKDTLITKTINKTADTSTAIPWNILCKTLSIIDGNITLNTNQKMPVPNKFNGYHIGLNNLTLKLKNFKFNNNSLSATILETTAKERCGFTIDKLTGEILINKQSITLNDAFIKTPNSEIKKYVKLSGNNIITDLNDVVNKVDFNTDFDKAYISPIDINYFTNSLPPNIKTISIDGQISGTINNLIGKNLTLTTGTVTKILGNVNVVNITDPSNFNINISNAKVTTNINDIAIFYAPILNVAKPNIKALGIVNFNGNAIIKAKSYEANGFLSTALGNINLNGSYMFNNGLPKYNGTLATNSFALGKFLNDSKLGEINLDATIAGTGLKLDNIVAAVKANVRQIYFDSKVYQNLIVDATIKDKTIAGFFSSKNDYVNGSTNFSYNFNGTNSVAINSKQFSVNLQKLLNLPKPLTITGNGSINLKGSNIDDLLGSVNLKDAVLLSNNRKLNFNQLQLNVTKIGKVKTYKINTDEVEALIEGDFLVSKLPQTFQSFLYRYYPNLIKRDVSLPKNQNFTFNIKTKNIGDFLKDYISNIEGLDNGTIVGSINTSNANPSLYTQIFMPYVAYKNYKASNITLISNGNYDSLKTAINIGEFFADSLLIPDSKITLASSNDHTDFKVETTTNSSLEKALLHAQIHSLKDGFDVVFNKSNFLIKNKNWTIEEGGELSLSKTSVNSSRVKLYEGIQEIEIVSRLGGESGGLTELAVNLTHINIGDIMPYVLKSERLEGDLSASFVISDPLGNIHVISNDIVLNEMRFNNDSIGIFKVDNFNYLKSSNNIIFSTSSDNQDYNFTTNGIINLKNTDSLLDINLDINKLSLKILNKYLSNVFYDIKGFGSGIGRIYGSSKQQFVNGSITTQNASLGVNYTKVVYAIKNNQPIAFTNNSINFGAMVLYDTDIKNNGKPRAAILNGILYHNFFKNFEYDFQLSAQNKQRGIQLLNTTEADNSQFFGYAVGNANVSFTGNESNMKLVVDNIIATEPAQLTLPDESTLSSGLGDIKIRETTKLQDDSKTKSQSNIDIIVNAKPTPLVKMKLIIDGATGDAINARGSGNISLTAGSRLPLTLSGSYIIADSSTYDFTLNSVLKFSFLDLNFKIKPGGIIKWSSSPYDAEIDITADYATKEPLKLSDLNPGGTGDFPFNRSARSRVNVSATLSDKLFKPRIKLGLDLLDNSDAKVTELFANVKNDSIEVLRQASTVILLNKFFPIGNGSNVASNNTNSFVDGFGNKVLNTLTGQLTNEFSKFINQKIFKALGINFDAGASLDNNISGTVRTNGTNRLITSAYFKLSKNLWKDRIVFHADSDFDFEAARRLNNSGFLPNVYIDFLISAKREVKLSLYYKSSLEFNSAGLRNRMGVTVRKGWDF